MALGLVAVVAGRKLWRRSKQHGTLTPAPSA
jgi:hypothetical protein